MKLTIPITGTVTDFDPGLAKLDGIGVSGDPADPIRAFVDLGNVGWHLISINLEAETADIEVEAPAKSADGTDLTPAQKTALLLAALNVISAKTMDQHYISAGVAKPTIPKVAKDKYIAYKQGK